MVVLEVEKKNNVLYFSQYKMDEITFQGNNIIHLY